MGCTTKGLSASPKARPSSGLLGLVHSALVAPIVQPVLVPLVVVEVLILQQKGRGLLIMTKMMVLTPLAIHKVFVLCAEQGSKAHAESGPCCSNPLRNILPSPSMMSH